LNIKIQADHESHIYNGADYSVSEDTPGNNYKLLKTSRESGVGRNTLRRWIESMGSQVFTDSVFKITDDVSIWRSVFILLIMNSIFQTNINPLQG
jgi:hypothetical protein